ncbi:MAG: hypothetical protein Q7U78_07475 [Gallionella sp.]|nr:hypothetical protein [Gallionella sp.]
MATEDKRKSGGGKLTRSETVTVRLDPKLRYLAELAARKQRRTLSSFIEWAIQDSLERVKIYEGNGYNGDIDVYVGAEAAILWDVDDSDRFAKLAVRYPDLLTHEEQILWKLIKENGLLWRGNWRGSNGEFQWKVEESSLIFERLRDHWEIFNKVASGESPKSALPTWNKIQTASEKKPEVKNPFDFDDDIPF